MWSQLTVSRVNISSQKYFEFLSLFSASRSFLYIMFFLCFSEIRLERKSQINLLLRLLFPQSYFKNIQLLFSLNFVEQLINYSTSSLFNDFRFNEGKLAVTVKNNRQPIYQHDNAYDNKRGINSEPSPVCLLSTINGKLSRLCTAAERKVTAPHATNDNFKYSINHRLAKFQLMAMKTFFHSSAAPMNVVKQEAEVPTRYFSFFGSQTHEIR